MIIKKASQILLEITKYELKKIAEFKTKIVHAPTIGKQYEGVTLKALDHVIDENFNLKVVSGFIKNSKNKLSGQIDCMVCFGNGEIVPGTTDDYVYEINQVLAVIEVKKNLFTNELKDSYEHLLDVNDLICDFDSIPAKLVDRIHTNFAQITGIIINERKDLQKINNDFYKMIYHGLIAQFIMPLRIIIGYDGFASEKSLRNKFVNYLSSNHNTKGFGPFSFPDLILCGDNCLVKLNGEPYVPSIKKGFFEFYASSSSYNIKILTELLFSRISRYIQFDFSDDDNTFTTKQPFSPHESALYGNLLK